VNTTEQKYYITVILPLKLSWDPWYYSDREIPIGTRVNVRFAGRPYTAVVSNCSTNPGIEESIIHPIENIEDRLEPITTEELKLWTFISEYYLCTIGEVYKAAYPQIKTQVETRKSRSKKIEADLDQQQPQDFEDAIAIEEGKPVLFICADRGATYQRLIAKTLSQGKDVLYISPSSETLSYTEIREISKSIRDKSSPARLIVGRKTQLFLPYAKLGLIIIDEEQDKSYKQDSPAPRYNGRDVAVMLAAIHKANIILGTSSPSLESMHNALLGKYALVRKDRTKGTLEVIDTTKEARKNGMDSDLSKKLIAIKEELESQKQKILICESWETGRLARLKLERYSAIALLHFEFLLSRQDFRADEKALQLIENLRSRVSRLILQTKDETHPVFKGSSDLLSERKLFNLPPFTRQINIKIRDNNKGREAKMASMLCEKLKRFNPLQMPGKEDEIIFNIHLAKDKSLGGHKKEIRQIISDFEQSANYTAHITIDVDPL